MHNFRIVAVTLALLLQGASAACASEDLTGAQLAKARNCLACHQTKGNLIGPGFLEIAQKYADNPTAAETLAIKVRKGGQGSWGPVPMPANMQVSEAEAHQLVKWILAR